VKSLYDFSIMQLFPQAIAVLRFPRLLLGGLLLRARAR